MSSYSLKVTCWNIQGLRSSVFGIKSQHSDFKKEIENSDIVILQETWNVRDLSTGCPIGFREIVLPSTKLRGVTQGRESGGMLIWYRAHLIDSITAIQIGKFNIWLKIQKDIVSTERPIFLCAIYLPPAESPYYSEETFSILQDEISHFQTKGNVLMCGDLNARTGNEPDFVNTQGDKYITNTSHSLPSYQLRNNYDKLTNKSGKSLLELCRSLGLYIVNGRIRGDSFGCYTFNSFLGNSTVDYFITDIDPVHLRAFTVSPQTPLSDHCNITLYLRRTHSNESHRQPSHLLKLQPPYKWTNNSTENYQNAIESQTIKLLLEKFILNTYSQNKLGINLALSDITKIFHQSASMCNLKNKSSKRKPKNTKEMWFDSECKNIRTTVRNLSNQKHRDPDNEELRHQYHEALRLYKQTLRVKKEEHTEQLFQAMEESINTSNFWNNWNTLYRPQQEDLVIQNGNIWRTHFENLYKTTETNPARNELKTKLEILKENIKDNQNPLDFPITVNELTDRLHALKPNKACGIDGILNEMIKYTNDQFRTAIIKLFNFVLRVGYFPDTWNQGLITPIFKQGDKYEPNNYRGICVNSNLGKIFCSIINTRLQNFLKTHKILDKSQIGFLPKHRTSDHIYTLHTIIDRHVYQNKSKIFACFIDFEKAFDSIWHEGLFLKLLENGIGGKTFDLISTMYKNNTCAVKIGNKRTEFFSQQRGVRQGCPLSPTLFNIYINELAKALNNSTAPGPTLTESEVKCLLFADDLVILSKTKEGLQQLLDVVETFSHTWALKINLAKTKIMIFQNRSRCRENKYIFRAGNQVLQHTQEYTYLGLKLSSTGNFNLAVNELKAKALRVFYMIKNTIRHEIPIQTWLKILKAIIEPIALYGSEIWGPLKTQDFSKWEKEEIETLHTQICKNILKVNRATPNNSCRAELGQYPLLISIQKRAVKFYQHLKRSEPSSYQAEALRCQEQNRHRSALSQLMLKLQPDQHSTIWPNQIIQLQKQNYITYWKDATKSQKKMELYLKLKREYKPAEYLSCVKEHKLRKTLSRYRLSDHRLAVERGRHRQRWQPREQRLCSLCSQRELETEEHFLIHCDHYHSIRSHYFTRFQQLEPHFMALPNSEKLNHILGENSISITTAAKYVTACHKLRESASGQN